MADTININVKYQRVNLMYKELRSYHLSTEFCYQILSNFFHIGNRRITTILSKGIQPDIEVVNFDLDQEWVKGLVKKIGKQKLKPIRNTQQKLFPNAQIKY